MQGKTFELWFQNDKLWFQNGILFKLLKLFFKLLKLLASFQQVPEKFLIYLDTFE